MDTIYPKTKNNNRKQRGQFFIMERKTKGVNSLLLTNIYYGIASGFPEIVVPSPNFSNACLNGLSPGNWSEEISYNPEGSCNGYGVVTVLTNPDRLLLEVKDHDGNPRLSYTLY